MQPELTQHYVEQLFSTNYNLQNFNMSIGGANSHTFIKFGVEIRVWDDLIQSFRRRCKIRLSKFSDRTCAKCSVNDNTDNTLTIMHRNSNLYSNIPAHSQRYS